MEDHHHIDIYDAILMLKTKDEVKRFLTDLCTPQEMKALNERWLVCQLLHNKNLSYRAISNATGVSTTTVTRVSRFLHDEPYKGYKIILERIKNVKKNSDNSNNTAKHTWMREKT